MICSYDNCLQKIIQTFLSRLEGKDIPLYWQQYSTNFIVHIHHPTWLNKLHVTIHGGLVQHIYIYITWLCEISLFFNWQIKHFFFFFVSILISLKMAEGRNPSTQKVFYRIPYSVEKEEQRFKISYQTHFNRAKTIYSCLAVRNEISIT